MIVSNLSEQSRRDVLFVVAAFQKTRKSRRDDLSFYRLFLTKLLRFVGMVRLEVSVYVVPVTRAGRTLTDWPRALSLKPDEEARKN